MFVFVLVLFRRENQKRVVQFRLPLNIWTTCGKRHRKKCKMWIKKFFTKRWRCILWWYGHL